MIPRPLKRSSVATAFCLALPILCTSACDQRRETPTPTEDTTSAGTNSPNATGQLRIDRQAYLQRLRGFWLGGIIANWTGLPTENMRTAPPFFTDDDWGTRPRADEAPLDYVLTQSPWLADDDLSLIHI